MPPRPAMDTLPPMPAPLPPPPSSARGVPSKTLFGMPGLSFDSQPGDPGLPFPDDDDELPFPNDDDEEDAPIAPPVRSSSVPKSPPPPPRPGGGGAKPSGAQPGPPPLRPAASKPPSPPPLRPPPTTTPRAKPAAPPPPPVGAKPPPPPPGKAASAQLPAFPGPPAPPKPALAPLPAVDAFSSGVLPGDSGAFADDDDPFFAGDPDQLDELGSITHGDASQFEQASSSGVQEFEFDDGGATIELGDFSGIHDLPAPVAPHRLPDISAPDFAGLNIPDAPALEEPDDFDLPAPVSTPTGRLDPTLPISAGSTSELDLPGMPDLDLPAPLGPNSGLDLPTPLDRMDLDDSLSIDDLPMPEDDDFPAPKLDDFGGFEALPVAADGLPPAAHDLPAPADVLPTPAADLRATGPRAKPFEPLELDLDEGESQAEPQPDASKPDASEPNAAAAAAPSKPLSKASGTIITPDRKPKRDITRYVVYGVLGLAVLVVGGGYAALELGLLEPEAPPPPAAQRNNDDGPQPPPTPTSEPSERSEELLAKFDLDTPAAYVQVLTLAADAGDAMAQAEAALLLHYRFGPDPERLALAGQLLSGFEGATQPFVRRVVGLGLLAAGNRDQALAHFDAEEPRSQLYRAWALLETERFEDARAAAEAVSAARPNDRAAQLAVLQARFAANPIDGIAAMRQAAGSASNHLALHEALMAAVLAQGRLAEATTLGQALELGAASTGHKAEILRRRAGIAAARGQLGEAMRLLDQALEQDSSLLAARLDRIELWLQNRDFLTLRTEVDLLLREHGSKPAVLKLAARVKLQAGDADEARNLLAQLGEAAAGDPEVHDILGQAHAVANEVAQAQAAFAEARKLDALYWQASVHEAELLVRDLQPDAGLQMLAEQAQRIEKQDGKSSARARRALAALARQRALVHRDRGRLEQALTAAEEAIAIDPADNDALLLRAQLLGELGQRSAHEEALAELHERTGGYPGLTEPFGKVLLRKNQLAELEALIGDQLASEDASREILLTGAALRLAQARGGEAKALAQRVLDRDLTDSRAHLLLGRALLLEGEYARALDEIQSAQTREGDAEVELWLGQALEYNGRANEARAHYSRALDIDPHNLEAAALLGRLFAYEGASRKAIELLRPVVDATNDYPYAWLAIGLAQRDLNQRAAAIASFQKAQQYDPTLFEAYYQEGRIHNDQNQHSAAVKALQAGVDKAADNAQELQLVDAWRRLGESYFQLGRRSEAKQALEEYMKLAPASAAGRREVERLLRDL